MLPGRSTHEMLTRSVIMQRRIQKRVESGAPMVWLVASVLGLATVAAAATGSNITEYPAAMRFADELGGIVTGPDGALWFADSNGTNIGRITSAGRVTAKHPVPTPNSYP